MRHVSGIKLPGILFLAYPFIEIIIFVLVCRLIGVLGALVLFAITTAFGSYLLRRSGFSRNMGPLALLQLQSANMFRVFAGFLLVLPGFFTDALGLLLLLPWSQRFFLHKVMRVNRPSGAAASDSRSQNGTTIEGEYWREDKTE